MKDLLCDEFQTTVATHLVQNKSILDTLAKVGESSARIQRTVSRAVTQCGCVRIEATRQVLPENVTFHEAREHLDSHVRGSLCPECRDRVETEVGSALFYLTAVCDLLGVSLYDCLLEEAKRVNALGMFHLS